MTDELRQRDHERFVKHLDASSEAVFKCAEYLYLRGVQVAICPMTKSKGYDDRLDHQDNGDLYIQQRIEVKHSSRDFTCIADWPFTDFIVCARHSYDNANPKPYAYMILNAEKTHVAVVYGRLKAQWWVKTLTDKRYEDMTQEFYMCKPEIVEIKTLHER